MKGDAKAPTSRSNVCGLPSRGCGAPWLDYGDSPSIFASGRRCFDVWESDGMAIRVLRRRFRHSFEDAEIEIVNL